MEKGPRATRCNARGTSRRGTLSHRPPGGTSDNFYGTELLLGHPCLGEGLHHGSVHPVHQRRDQLLELLQAQPPVVVQLFGRVEAVDKGANNSPASASTGT